MPNTDQWLCTCLLFLLRNRLLKLSHRLKHYPVSEELRECLLLKEDITFVRPNLDDVSVLVCVVSVCLTACVSLFIS